MECKTWMRLNLFFTVWDIRLLMNSLLHKLQGLTEGKMDKFIANEKNIVIGTLYKLSSLDFALNISAGILDSFYKV